MHNIKIRLKGGDNVINLVERDTSKILHALIVNEGDTITVEKSRGFVYKIVIVDEERQKK